MAASAFGLLAFAAVGAALKVAVVGAGPAGLSLALALQRLPGRQCHVSVFEQYEQIRPAVGGGIQLSSGAAILARLGLGEQLVRTALPLRSLRSRRANGAQVLRLDSCDTVSALAQTLPEPAADIADVLRSAGAEMLPLGDGAGDVVGDSNSDGDGGGDGAFAIMRDALQQLLVDALEPGTLQLGAPLESARTLPGGGVACRFGGGGGGDGEMEFDLLVGCDGIGSRVKNLCFPEAAGPAYSGLKVLFCVVPGGSRDAEDENEFHQWLGDGAYCLSASYGALGGGSQEMLALCYKSDTPATENAIWAEGQGLRAQAVQRLTQAEMPRELVRMAEAAERFYETPVYFRRPQLGWSRGPVVLAGDAAHAMPPFLGQGANQAICDAYCLASQLKRLGPEGDLRPALAEYEWRRVLPTGRLLLNSRILGYIETQAGLGALLRDAFFYVAGKLGVARLVFLDGAIPRGV